LDGADSGQGAAGNARNRVKARASSSDHGQSCCRRRMVRRPVRITRAAVWRRRCLNRLGSQSRASPDRHSRWVHAIRHWPVNNNSSQTWLKAAKDEGRFINPVPLAQRIPSSMWARQRCRFSNAAMSGSVWFVMNTWCRIPLRSHNRNCAPSALAEPPQRHRRFQAPARRS
jgi:hypothetical protein